MLAQYQQSVSTVLANFANCQQSASLCSTLFTNCILPDRQSFSRKNTNIDKFLINNKFNYNPSNYKIIHLKTLQSNRRFCYGFAHIIQKTPKWPSSILARIARGSFGEYEQNHTKIAYYFEWFLNPITTVDDAFLILKS